MPTPEERIAELAPNLLFGGHHCQATDPIGMEFAIERGDPAYRNQLIALRFETVAAMQRIFADSAEKAAKIVAEKSQ
jgi:hypothetical protein